MKVTQKVIKYLAISFGIFLSITIISSILFSILAVGSVLTGVNLYASSKDLVEDTIQITETVEHLDIDLEMSKFNIKTGEEFKIETKAPKDNYEIEVKDNTLRVKEKGKNIFSVNNAELTIYIPMNMEFKTTAINLGIGETKIERLLTEESNIDISVGSVKIDSLMTEKSTNIKGGVGKLELHGNLRNLHFNSGVGASIIEGIISGDSKVEAGIGKLELDLSGDDKWYSIETEIGIGTVKLNGEKCEENKTYGSGGNILKVEGGIGSVEITTKAFIY